MSRKNLNERYINKKIHGYFRKQLEKDNNIDIEKSNSRSVNKNMTSHFEGYYSAIGNVTVMMENNQPVTTNADSVRPT